jgi:Response regulator containing CheY-like receiver, AAA-type ATPase, and DNA-binding domains
MNNKSILIDNGVNLEKSLEIFGDMDIYNESLEDFLSEVGEKLTNIKAYKEAADMSNYAILVHSLKSDCKYFGFDHLAQIAYKHEIESKANNINFVYDDFNTLMTEAAKVVDIVKQYLGKSDVPNLAVTSELKAKKTDKKVLIVDDSNIVRNFVQKLLDDSYEVLVAKDGQEALETVETHLDELAGMLLDLNMPNVNGFEVLNYFKLNKLFDKIPVAIITGNDSREVDDKAFEYPIIDMLKKPFNERDVKKIIERMVMEHNEEN